MKNKKIVDSCLIVSIFIVLLLDGLKLLKLVKINAALFLFFIILVCLLTLIRFFIEKPKSTFYNHQEPLFVPKKFGIGWAINRKNRSSYLIYGLLLVIIVLGLFYSW